MFNKVWNIKSKKDKIKTLSFKNLLWKKKSYCPVCNQTNVFLTFGVVTRRKNAKCRNCGAFERHRFMYHIYKKEFLDADFPVKIMHTAPENCISDLIFKNPYLEYIPVDLQPENYNFINCMREDVTNLSFGDETFDFILSNHVMEHILDEEKFLSELLRVLKTGGKLILTFPINFNLEKTFEDSSITTDEDRLKYYGQRDHVRVYGLDIIDKLKNNYNTDCITPEEILSDEAIEKMSLLSPDVVFVITKDRSL
ncbi:MAG: methyltransferase domain-containing protein [Candidatus Gastranaerophilales bacterium]|nr:methyltransferase domain-containing protein [Candidatus Gastranaerophilales bacterium]